MRNARDGLIKNLHYLCLIGIIALGLMTIVGTGGDGGSGTSTTPTSDTTTPISDGGDGDTGGGDTEIPSAGGEIVQLNVVLGPIVGATVNVYPLDDRDTQIASGVTEDSEDINEAGRVSLEIPPEYSDTPLFMSVDGGVDIDADDDGVRDEEPTDNDITLEFVFPTPDDLEGLRIVANSLLLFASRHVLENLWGDEPITDPEEVRTLMERVAKALIREDINGDGTIGWKDIVSFNPLTDQEKSIIPWGYVLDDIERRRQDYHAELTLNYYYIDYVLDPQYCQPFDVNGDGEWTYKDTNFCYFIRFSNDKDGYTMQDLRDGQGCLGGRVELPGDATITYSCSELDVDGDQVADIVEDDPEPPLLDEACSDEGSENSPIRGIIGGYITDPESAPVGEYRIHYRTGDGLEHQEIMYLHENRAESLFYVIPVFEIDQDGFIESITCRFEDGNRNVLESPPVLGGFWGSELWDTPDQVNSLVRGEDFYAPITDTPGCEKYLYNVSLNCISLLDPVYPKNNGHKIYYEDLARIWGVFMGGDGVNREFYFYNNQDELYPQLADFNLSDGQVTVAYSPASATGREVVSIRYKFDNGEWEEIAGDILTAVVPSGASKLYITAKDTAGFYKYPPGELDVE